MWSTLNLLIDLFTRPHRYSMLPNFNTMILCETILGKTLANIYFPQIVSPLDTKVRVLPKSELVSQRDFVVSHMVKDYLKKQRLLRQLHHQRPTAEWVTALKSGNLKHTAGHEGSLTCQRVSLWDSSGGLCLI